MARESLASKRERAATVEERMFAHYGPGKASLDYTDRKSTRLNSSHWS